ncbi:Cellulose synthase-like protein D4 [Platanthera guangdongensis]|uniref:Cellulose synthase-like protein D4 n=1 Tax=Platanthera guangdongensis TaxID=2320717 RepID=A0ABR2MJD1_9ASPA
MASIPAKKPTVTFARKTSSGRYVSLSRDDIDLTNYSGPLPPIPDDHPVDEAEGAGDGSSTPCAMPGCDGFVEKDEQGQDVHPCECRYGTTFC